MKYAEREQQALAQGDEGRGLMPARPRQIDRAIERDLAVLEHQHAVGEAQRFIDIMGDQQDCARARGR
jgi:hypothetical protein